MTKEKRALIEYRMERARETLDEAKMLFDGGHLNAYVSRLYYACFYAASALLLTKGFSTSKHGYLRSLLHREFVKAGLIPKNLGTHFDLLFDNRHKGDYDDFVTFKTEQVAPWLERTREFVNHIDRLIQTAK
ncbi:MAG: HEPN domain-containing protein [Sedimentisphaerales bacterium]|nr:HEPN domain-containing protein [Sedimentisphaerales bacterium]